jgi:hypothetical protein
VLLTGGLWVAVACKRCPRTSVTDLPGTSWITPSPGCAGGRLGWGQAVVELEKPLAPTLTLPHTGRGGGDVLRAGGDVCAMYRLALLPPAVPGEGWDGGKRWWEGGGRCPHPDPPPRGAWGSGCTTRGLRDALRAGWGRDVRSQGTAACPTHPFHTQLISTG